MKTLNLKEFVFITHGFLCCHSIMIKLNQVIRVDYGRNGLILTLMLLSNFITNFSQPLVHMCIIIRNQGLHDQLIPENV